MWGECENFVSTDPIFDSRESCREYSKQVVTKIREQLPDSSGRSYCMNEEELKTMTDELLNHWQNNESDLDQSIQSI